MTSIETFSFCLRLAVSDLQLKFFALAEHGLTPRHVFSLEPYRLAWQTTLGAFCLPTGIPTGGVMFKLGDVGLRPIATHLRRVVHCKGKLRHSSRGSAESAMRSLIRRGLHRPEEGDLNVYQCPRCLTWHVGHTRKRRERTSSSDLRTTRSKDGRPSLSRRKENSLRSRSATSGSARAPGAIPASLTSMPT